MSILETPRYRLKYIDNAEPWKNIPAVTQSVAETLETAMTNALIPPGNPDLNDVLARLNMLEAPGTFPKPWVQLTVANGGLVSGFGPVGGDADNCRYRLHGPKLLEIYCYVAGTFNKAFGKLPAGYRPSKVVQVTVAADNGVNYVFNINTAGDILLTGGAATSAVCYIMLGLA